MPTFLSPPKPTARQALRCAVAMPVLLFSLALLKLGWLQAGVSAGELDRRIGGPPRVRL
jgi:hypothetical protein